MNKLRLLAGAVVTGATLALLAPAGPAQAASCTITPRSVTLHAKAKKVQFDVSGNPTTWYIDIPDLGITPGVWPDGVQDVRLGHGFRGLLKG